VTLALEKGTLSEEAAQAMLELIDTAINPEGMS